MIVTIARGLIIAAAAIVAVLIAMIVGAHRVVVVRAILRTGDYWGQSGHGKGCEGEQCGSQEVLTHEDLLQG